MFSHQDGTATLTSDILQIPIQLASPTKATFDPGSKRKLIGGQREAPLYVAIGNAEPKVTVEMSSALEYWNAWQACGGAGIPGATVTLSFVFFNILLAQPWDFEFLGIVLPAPPWDSGDSGVVAKLDFMPTDVFLNGTSIYMGSI
ncbi:MAG TPA: hypothetical protein VIM73_11630 [Polyangiaceae bacterium]